MYEAAADRYQSMIYRRSGRSGLLLPAISLGLWHNFGGVDALENSRAMLRRAFDLGITHFDLANNYGPPPGSAEETFGRVLRADLGAYRDQIIVSTKAGYEMWPGPYGNWGSRKFLLASLDQSLARMGLEYVDVFYSHRPDPETPLEETMSALAHAVRSGKALYAGISNYDVPRATAALEILRSLGTPCLIHQMKYSMFQRAPEDGLFALLASAGSGAIAFSPLAQGLLTNRYLDGIPAGSRASKPYGFLKAKDITPERLQQVRALSEMAHARRQSLAQMAVAWVLRQPAMTSALVGASSVGQLDESVQALRNLEFSPAELRRIDEILA
ncbi:MAG TPA: aldo/keto reductase [Bryobacteraceae bacterium]|nr:aldo/keto reductase [Bryobacteraceae bacterium]